MASPHASSFICLPFSWHVDVITAHTVYFSVCIVSAAVGIIGAVLFLTQIIISASLTKSLGGSSSQRWILKMLAASDLLANIGKNSYIKNLVHVTMNESIVCFVFVIKA